MAKLTDPAKELYEAVQRLLVHANERGDIFLAGQFGVEPYSTEFYKIIAAILERADKVESLLPRLVMDDDTRQNARVDIEGLKSAFGHGSLWTPWQDSGRHVISEYGRGLQYLPIRSVYAYPKLDEDEASELLEMLNAYQASFDPSGMPPYLAQAVRDGLEQAIFLLRHLQWTSGAYQLRVFRELEAVSLSIQKWAHEGGEEVFRPDLVLNGLRDITGRFMDTVSKVKGHSEVLSWLAIGYNFVAPLGGYPALPQLGAP